MCLPFFYVPFRVFFAHWRVFAIFVRTFQNLLMSGKFYRFLAVVLLLASVSALATPTDRVRKHILDSLELRLQEINNAEDSVVPLYNIYDLSTSKKERTGALYELYQSARKNSKANMQSEMLINLSRLYRDNDSALVLIENEAATLPVSDRREETLLYVRMLMAENHINNGTPEEQTRALNEIVKQFTSNPPDDKYRSTELLFALCIAMSKTTKGELLQKYLSSLIDQVETLNLGTGLVRNLVYGRAAPIFTRNRFYSDAIEIDKKMLNVIDSLTLAYSAHGRPYRKLYDTRYNVNARMLVNYRGLSPEEVELSHDNIRSLVKLDPEVARMERDTEIGEIFYRVARKEYAMALPMLKRQVDNPDNGALRPILLRELLDAAEATGDSFTQLQAAMGIVHLFDTFFEEGESERYRELQLLYDLNDIRKKTAEKQLQAKDDVLRMNRTLLIVTGAVCLLLILSFFWMVRQYRRLKHLAAEHFKTTVTLRAERNDLKRAQQELIEARDKAYESERQKTEFTNMMSHEVKAPLGAVQEYTRLLSDCITGEQSRYLQRFAFIIDRNVNALNRLVSDVLDMTSLDYSSMTVNKSVDSVQNICKVAMETIFRGGQASSDKVKLVFNSHGTEDRMIVTDVVRVQQVLMNLLDNADKFTDSGTISLEYEIDEENNEIRFIVSDTGIGIPDDCEEVIFERYRKLDPHTRGLGLGLYISRRIAILLRGDVRVDMDYHRGSRFIFTIKGEDCTTEE